MKIANANISLQSQHQQQNRHYISEDLRIRNGNNLSVQSQIVDVDEQKQAVEGKVTLSEQALKLFQSEQLNKNVNSANIETNNENQPQKLLRKPLFDEKANEIKDALKNADNDPKILLIRAIIEAITGKSIKLASDNFGGGDSKNTSSEISANNENSEATNSQEVFGVKYRATETFSEKETTSFSANGIINTADGKQIQFQCDLLMKRSFSVSSTSEVAVANTDNLKNLFDPLVINFEGNATELRNSTFAFDLNADGKAENIHELNSGNAFLVLDKNGDGKINNGNEMFGTQSGDGFADLAAYDEDGNGWIDENDSVYNSLGVWSNHTYGGQIRSLKQAGIGAIYLENVNTEFSIKEQKSNELQGQIRKTGIFVNEKDPQNISVGTIQHVDLAV